MTSLWCIVCHSLNDGIAIVSENCCSCWKRNAPFKAFGLFSMRFFFLFFMPLFGITVDYIFRLLSIHLTWHERFSMRNRRYTIGEKGKIKWNHRQFIDLCTMYMHFHFNSSPILSSPFQNRILYFNMIVLHYEDIATVNVLWYYKLYVMLCYVIKMIWCDSQQKWNEM